MKRYTNKPAFHGEKNVLSRAIKYFYSYVMGEDSSSSGYCDPTVYNETFFRLSSLLKQCCAQRQTQTPASPRQKSRGCGVNTPSAPDVYPPCLRAEAERPVVGPEGRGYESSATGGARSGSTGAVGRQPPGLEPALWVRCRQQGLPPLPEPARLPLGGRQAAPLPWSAGRSPQHAGTAPTPPWLPTPLHQHGGPASGRAAAPQPAPRRATRSVALSRRAGSAVMRGRLLRAGRAGAAAPPWRVLFFGTDRFAVTALRALKAARYRLPRRGDGPGGPVPAGWVVE